MSDLISRQAAIDALDEQIETCDKSLSSFDISMKDAYAVKVERASLVSFREILEYLPSAEPKRGKWIYQMGMIKCDQCLRAIRRIDHDGLLNFCPNCGADMREVTE